MNKIVHISKYKRFGPQGVHTGGVGKFAWYLRRAIPELIIYAWEDYPQWQEHDLGIQEWDQAPLLNGWLLESGLVDKDTIAIVDGWWGMGLENKVARLISVCHGSYAGAMVEHMRNPWDNGFILGQSVRYQEKFWGNSFCEIVAVSPNAAKELKLLSGLDSTVICNGIDLEIFNAGHRAFKIPRAMKKRDLILEVTGGHPAKGAHIVEALRRQGYNIKVHGITDGNLEHEAERWAEAEIALLPSFYEGYSYALIEALACGCIPVAYYTGLAHDLPPGCGEFTDDHHENAFARCLNNALFDPAIYLDVPAYVRDDYDFEYFAQAWRDYANLG